MAIHVTTIPRLSTFASPSFTLGTANAAGTNSTVVRSDATLLTFDTATPAAVAQTGAVGSATVAPRRDHQHAGGSGATKLWGVINAADGVLKDPHFGIDSTGHDSAGVYTINLDDNFDSTVYGAWAAMREPVPYIMTTSNWAIGTYKVRGYKTTDQAAVNVDFSTGAFGDLA